MAVGTTANFAYSRNGIIESALRKIGGLKRGESPTFAQVDDAANELVSLVREEDLEGSGVAKFLWALSETHLVLSAGGYIYSSSEGLPTDIAELVHANFRDTSGGDWPLDIITQEEYEALADKKETGDVDKVYLKKNRLLASQKLYVWPAPASVGTTSEVTGSDALNYQCVLGHTSATINKPITGGSYSLYWKQAGSAGSAWASDTAYTNGEILRLVYKRPLFDFDLATDNADFPAGWDSYLVWALAVRLSPEYKVPLEERVWIERQATKSKDKIFRGTRSDSNTHHNKSLFY